MKAGQSEQSISNEVFNKPIIQITGDTFTFSREQGDEPTKSSTNIYYFVYTPSMSFEVNEGDYFMIVLPSELETIGGLTEPMTFSELTDSIGSDISNCVRLEIVSAFVKISGYSNLEMRMDLLKSQSSFSIKLLLVISM